MQEGLVWFDDEDAGLLQLFRVGVEQVGGVV